MKRWIRWKGLIAFIVAVIVITVVWVLVVDTVVRRGIEYVGTRAVGARMDVAKADLTLFPTGLELNGIAVTNPNAPMQNAVEIATMHMDLDPGYLIRRKVIIGDMLMEGLRFDTPRETSGEVPELAGQDADAQPGDGASLTEGALEKICGEFSMPSLTQPDVKAILAKESLASVELAQDLEKKIQADKENWEKKLTQLPDEKKLKAYEARIKKIEGTGGGLQSLLGAAGDIQTLQADIRKDLKLLDEAQTAFTKDFTTYRKQVNTLTQAPIEDIQRLAEKYSLTTTGLGNLSQLIFGERLCRWMGTVAKWYDKIRPYLDKLPEGGAEADEPIEQEPIRGKGTNIRFAETPPMPDFLIRRLKVSADLAAGKFSGKAENITLDQNILGSPTTFAFLGRNMPHIDALSLNGTANYINPAQPKTDAKMTLKGLGLVNLSLVRDESFPLTVKHAVGNLDADFSTVDDVLDATINGDFSTVQFVSDTGKAQTGIASAMASAISGIDRFSLTANVAGAIDAYTVDVKSDLDKVLKSAVGNLVKNESTKFKARLKEEINARLKGPMGKANVSLTDLDAIEAELAKRLDLGDDLLKGLKLPF